MKSTPVLTITDDSGYIALVNAELYESFVGVDWDWEGIMSHFNRQMKAERMLLWETGNENEWKIAFPERFTEPEAENIIQSRIKVTNEKLWMTNYEDLTMAAQYRDEKIPGLHNKDLFVELPNGTYDVTVRKLSSDIVTDPVNMIDFEIVFEKTTLND